MNIKLQIFSSFNWSYYNRRSKGYKSSFARFKLRRTFLSVLERLSAHSASVNEPPSSNSTASERSPHPSGITFTGSESLRLSLGSLALSVPHPVLQRLERKSRATFSVG